MSSSPICWRMVQSTIECWYLRLNLSKMLAWTMLFILYVFPIFCAWKQLFIIYGIPMYFILIYTLAMIARLVFFSEICKFGRFYLIIAYLPEGILVPNVSSPLDLISYWKAHNSKDIKALFSVFHHSWNA